RDRAATAISVVLNAAIHGISDHSARVKVPLAIPLMVTMVSSSGQRERGEVSSTPSAKPLASHSPETLPCDAVSSRKPTDSKKKTGASNAASSNSGRAVLRALLPGL